MHSLVDKSVLRTEKYVGCKSLLLPEIGLIIKAFLLLIAEMFDTLIFGDRHTQAVHNPAIHVHSFSLIGPDDNKHPAVNVIINTTSELQIIQKFS